MVRVKGRYNTCAKIVAINRPPWCVEVPYHLSNAENPAAPALDDEIFCPWLRDWRLSIRLPIRERRDIHH
ncbi:hypothetical protein M0804_004636 [Polistes exclamans]|nr:hypothetical protein M0804_004636 [Polistes exclamans]